MFRRLLFPLACSLALIAAVGAATSPSTTPLTTCAAIRGLTTAEAAQALPVRLRGVITVAPGLGAGGFTLDDGTGIWIARPRGEGAANRPVDLRAGDLVEVQGRTQAGHFLPTVTATEVKRLGRQPLPPGREISQFDLTNGALDGQRVLVRGVVQAAERSTRGERTELRLVVSTANTRFSYVSFDAPTLNPEELVDAEVQFSGVFLAYFNSRRQFLGARVRANDASDFQITKVAPTDAFAVPEISLSDGMLFSAQGGSPHRRRVKGIVTLCVPGEYFVLQEKEHALRIKTRMKERLEPGDVVEASGFFTLEHHKAEMLDAIFRRLGRTTAPVAEEISGEQLFTAKPGSAAYLARDYDDYLVSLRGQLVSIDVMGSANPRLNLECDGVLIPAEITSGADIRLLSTLRTGSYLQVTGVCGLTFSGSPPVVEWPQPIAARLLLRDPGDIEVVVAASWWTRERLWGVLGLVGIILVGTLAWAALLRRRVAVRGRELAEAMRERRDAAVEFESTLRERNRLAADLHDTLEQSLTGLALQLEASEALQGTEKERSQQHMALAKQVLDRSREDLRRSIWNLRANPLDAANLTDALREIAATRSAGLSLRIVVQSTGQTRPLPEFVAGNLLLLTQEAITNAIKHAKASEIRIGLEFAEKSVTLEVADDGVGFQAAHAAGPKQGHFGLQGMKERIKRLGGQLRILTQPGSGTRVRVTVPE